MTQVTWQTAREVLSREFGEVQRWRGRWRFTSAAASAAAGMTYTCTAGSCTSCRATGACWPSTWATPSWATQVTHALLHNRRTHVGPNSAELSWLKTKVRLLSLWFCSSCGFSVLFFSFSSCRFYCRLVLLIQFFSVSFFYKLPVFSAWTPREVYQILFSLGLIFFIEALFMLQQHKVPSTILTHELFHNEELILSNQLGSHDVITWYTAWSVKQRKKSHCNEPFEQEWHLSEGVNLLHSSDVQGRSYKGTIIKLSPAPNYWVNIIDCI